MTWEFDGPQAATLGASATPGWSESWYCIAATVDAALNAGLARGINDWITLRRPFLANIYRIARVRATSTTNVRLSKAASVDNAFGTAADAAQVTCCALVDFTALPADLQDTTHHRRAEFRGLSTDMINGNVFEPGAAYNAMLRFCDQMGGHQTGTPVGVPVGQPWQIQVQSQFTPKQPLLGLVISGATNRFITVTNDFGPLDPGTKLRITGVKFPAFINRVWKVRATAGVGPQNSPYVLGNSRRELAGVWDGVGNIQQVDPVYRVCDQYSPVGLRTRATGRPSPLTRGRRSRG